MQEQAVLDQVMARRRAMGEPMAEGASTEKLAGGGMKDVAPIRLRTVTTHTAARNAAATRTPVLSANNSASGIDRWAR
jgi:hypothetical protein